ncbi:MAG: proton-conducting transporter membrane subunit [Cryomorphaceae bacterium]|nr:Na+/H+ antiporter subunit D [Flavobacteriales bacterium]
MTEQIILLPILTQAVIAVVLLFCWGRIRVQQIISIAGSALNVIFAAWLFSSVWQNGMASVQSGNWEAPFGITFVADTLSATLVLLTAISGLAVSIYSTATIVGVRLKFGFLPILHFLLMGLCGAFLTGDIFNLYVWFEIIIISSFVLITLGSEKHQLEGAVKYFALNMLASIIFLTALGILYGLFGTLNMADLAGRIAAVENRSLVYVCALFFFVGFGIKSAVFPLYFWLPDSYHTPPTAVSAIFSGLLTKVGVYALIRVFTLLFTDDVFIDTVLLGVGVLTIFSGGIGALVQTNIRKIFSYLIICHIGFMIAGLGLFNELALAGMMFYLIHDILVKTNLFFVAGLIYKIKGSNDMRKLGGMYKTHPMVSLLLAIPLFSLVGIPPLSGFWPKISLILGAVEAGNYIVTGMLLFGSFITLLIIARVWAKVFWKPQVETKKRPDFVYFSAFSKGRKFMILLPVAMLAVVTIYVGFGAEHLNTLAERVATELLDTKPYIQNVLGK